ncbi:protein of unknown function [Maridesulfovibrio hydrothermalis AM13 = DSM 14728]|uniref:Uncharacterized protein n=1 Tax=Maridesulfovibrio hydrothermalis AM13 = DSM 14728 TaxID=1121451 RepID=L0R978_9BACT|nr:protein of unknown function [Maridesulfovibrio hydrothermalis AM13 = DSM 14728]
MPAHRLKIRVQALIYAATFKIPFTFKETHFPALKHPRKTDKPSFIHCALTISDLSNLALKSANTNQRTCEI